MTHPVAPPANTAYGIRSLIERRLAQERILIPLRSEAELSVPLCYPSPYHVAMSSLGYQVVYRLLNDPDYPRLRAERAFLPDDVPAWRRARLPLVTYESQTAVGLSPVILFSVAYELELTGLFSCLELASVSVLQSERGAGQPLVICGGPLTFSNPLPLGPFADIVVMGEAEQVLPRLMRELLDAGIADGHLLEPAERQRLLRALAGREGLWIPSVDGERLPRVAQCEDRLLPATSTVLTPNTELKSMFLIEPERGCSRGCTYCVMRRTTNGGMRLVDPEKIKALIPPEVSRVGLVGAAVTDHPKLPHILRHIVEERGLQVGISSLRADRLTDEIVGLLGRGGYRTLTVASDGASERLREVVERRTKERHLLRSAELAKRHGMRTLKVYMIVGLPGETDADIDELVRFATELSRIVPTSLGVAPFVAKRNTPLDATPFAGIAEVERRLARLRKGLGKHVEVRPTSARWAWVEYVLAQGGMEAGLRAQKAHAAGGGFAAWRKAFETWQGRAPEPVLPPPVPLPAASAPAASAPRLTLPIL